MAESLFTLLEYCFDFIFQITESKLTHRLLQFGREAEREQGVTRVLDYPYNLWVIIILFTQYMLYPPTTYIFSLPTTYDPV